MTFGGMQESSEGQGGDAHAVVPGDLFKARVEPGACARRHQPAAPRNGDCETVSLPPPNYLTETRHSKAGRTCHHFYVHGLTCDEYDVLRDRANGHCEICQLPEAETGGKRLVVDHTERPGLYVIRGLICDKCNAVMACVDGKKPWGGNRRWEERAVRYAARGWERPASMVPRIAPVS